jgi:alkylation response protein AidB-like acyl-CoA dehydrogenase
MNTLVSKFSLATLPRRAEAFRDEVRSFLTQALPPAPPHTRARSWMGYDESFSRALARRGWVGVTIPKRYGGAELDAFARFVLVEELLAAGAPVAGHWIADRQSGPLILKFGTQAQRDFYLPRICAGEASFCIGMSEPNSGSDLASVGTRARKTDGGWRLSGRKIWTTNAQHCRYMIALVRTSGEAGDRQKGLSQVIVDLQLPGVTVRPIVDLTGDTHFAEVFFDDVLLADHSLIGNEGDGWMQVNAELAFERSGPERIYSSIALCERWLSTLRAGMRSESAERLAGRLAGELATLRRMSISVTARLAAGESPVVESALVKDLGTSFEQDIPTLLADHLAADPCAEVDPALLATLDYLSHVAPTFSLRGGTREILRGMIARGLELR